MRKTFAMKILASLLVIVFTVQWMPIFPVVAGTQSKDEVVITDVVEPPEPKLTPVMGWASWNLDRARISETILENQMNALVSTGLADAGYDYFNVDDGFFAGRGDDGIVKIHPTLFPNGMKYIADLAHEKGLKAGIYSDAGTETCAYQYDYDVVGDNGKNVGLYGYEEQDLRTYLVDWGFDFIKVDWCGGQKLKLDEQTQYTKIGNIIKDIRKETGKHVVYNVCRWQFPGEWVVDVADSWRVGSDIAHNFSSVLYQIDQVSSLAKYNGPGHVNDLDMMVVGHGMTKEEDKSHFSMWCMMSTPLMLGNDLTKISQQTLDIVTNKELIALNQDPACLQATLAKTTGNGQIWVKDLGSKGSNTKAVTLLNRGTTPLEMTVNWSDIGLSDSVVVRDLWEHKDINVGSSYSVTIPAHGVVVLKVAGETPTSTSMLQANILKKPESVNITNEGTIDWAYYGAAETKNTTNVINDYVLSNGAIKNTYNDASTSYSWSDGKEIISGDNYKNGISIAGEGESYRISIPASKEDLVARLYFGGSSARLRVDATIGNKQITDYIEQDSGKVDGLYEVKFSSDKNETLTLTVTIDKSYSSDASANLEALTLSSKLVEGVIDYKLSDKPVGDYNLTEIGAGDWLFYGNPGGVRPHRKADVTPQLTFESQGAASNYSNSATNYTWTDGTPSSFSTGTKTGQGYNGLGAYAQFNAPSDTRERTINVVVGGYGAGIQIDVMLGGKLMNSEYMESKTSNVNGLVTATYSSEEPTTLSVKWSVVKAYDTQWASVAAEGATLSYVEEIDGEDVLYGSGYALSESTVNLDSAGNYDWVSFGGDNGKIAARKPDVNYISNYSKDIDANISQSDSPIKYTWQDGSSSSGASQPNLGNYFEFILPPSNDLKKADIYFGVKNADVTLTAELGGKTYDHNVYDISGGSNNVVSLWYKSEAPLKAKLALTGVFSDISELRLDAVTLSNDINNIITYPKVENIDGKLSVNTQIMQYNEQGFDTANIIAAIYDDMGRLLGSDMITTSFAEGEFIGQNNIIELPDNFDSGKLKVFLWDIESYAPLTDAFAFSLPMKDNTPKPSDPGFIGVLTAREKVLNGAVLIDVRTAEEYNDFHIEGSINIAHTDILSKINYEVPDKDDEIVVYCSTGKRSTQAKQLLNYLGYTNVYNLGSMDNWDSLPSVVLPYRNVNRYMLSTDKIFITNNASIYDNVEIRYSIGEDSTVEDSLEYMNQGVSLSETDTLKAYLLYQDVVYAETSQEYKIYTNYPIPTDRIDVYASDLPWISETTGWGEVKKDRSIDNNPITIAGNIFAKGIGTHASSEIVMQIPENSTRFIAVAGCDDEVGNQTNYINYQIFINDVLIEKTLELNINMYHVFDIDIPEGAQQIKLVADEGTDGNGYKHADWGIAGFIKGD